MLTACPTKTIESAKKQSSRIATYANSGVNITRILFNERVISLTQKDKIANAFIVLAHGGQAFDASVARLEAAYGDKVPMSEIEALFQVFDAQLVGKFLDILRELKVISAGNKYAEIIALLTSTVLIIAKAFGKKQEIQMKIEAVRI